MSFCFSSADVLQTDGSNQVSCNPSHKPHLNTNEPTAALTPSGDHLLLQLADFNALLFLILFRLKTSQELVPHLPPSMAVLVLRRLVHLSDVAFSSCVEENREPALQTWVAASLNL